MKKYLCAILIHLTGIVGIFVLGGFLLSYPVAAVNCAVPISGNMTISSSCVFSGTVDGIDAGTGTNPNTAVLTLSGGATLTVGASQTVAVGSFVPGTGSIAIITGGQIKVGTPLWMTDTDADSYPASSTQIAQASTPTGGRRRNILSSFTDRNDSNAAAYESRPLLDSAGNYGGWSGSDANAATLSTDNSTTYLSSVGAMKAVMSVNTGTGADGACTVSSGTMDINSASCAGRAIADAVNFSVTANTASGQNQVTVVTTPTGLAANDEIIIINLMGANAGTYETKIISSISTNTLTLTSNLTNAYNGTTEKIMVQRVPNYTSVTISSGATFTANAFSCSTFRGGVLSFKAAGTVSVSGTMNGNELGFPGGGITGDTAGFQGGSYTSCGGGISQSANTGGGGGGTLSVGWKGGGGGGAGYGAAGAGGNNSNQGALGGAGGGAYGTTTLSTLILGSGGGSGGNDRNGPNGTGGNGGGIVAIWVNTLTVNTGAAVRANGAAGGCGYNTAGGGGGGSGGSILIQAPTATLGTNLVTAGGGAGGGSGCSGEGGGGAGGAGGVGRIRCDNSAGTCTGSSPAPYSAALPSPLNVMMNRTLPAPLDLSGVNNISFWVNSGVTGSVLRFQMGEAAFTEQTFDFSVSAANTWEEKAWNISAITATSRDAIRYLRFIYLSGTAGTFRIDGLTYYE